MDLLLCEIQFYDSKQDTKHTIHAVLEAILSVIHPLLHCFSSLASPKCMGERQKTVGICFECKRNGRKKETDKTWGTLGKKQYSQPLQVIPRKPEEELLKCCYLYEATKTSLLDARHRSIAPLHHVIYFIEHRFKLTEVP